MSSNIVRLPTSYYPDPNQNRPIFNGSVYVGIVDLDPEIEANRKPLVIVQEDGTEVPIAIEGQPLKTGSGGVIMYDGSPIADLKVDGGYSLKVLNKGGDQEYYFPNVLDGTLVTINDIGELTNYVFATVADMITGTTIGGDVVVISEGFSLKTQGRITSGDGFGGDYVTVTSQAVDELFDHTLTGGVVAIFQPTSSPVNLGYGGLVDAMEIGIIARAGLINYINIIADKGSYTADITLGTTSTTGPSVIPLLVDNTSADFNDSTISILPNDLTIYSIAAMEGNNNKISNVHVIGDLLEHLGVAGEFGMGLALRGNNNGRIDNFTASNCWGDGIYVGTRSNVNAENNVFNNIECFGNGRNELSIVGAKTLYGNNIYLHDNPDSKNPGAGVDIEPNGDDGLLENIIFDNLVTERIRTNGVGIPLQAWSNNTAIRDVSITFNNYQSIDDKGGVQVYNLKPSLTGFQVNGSIVFNSPQVTRSATNSFITRNLTADSGLSVVVNDPVIIDPVTEVIAAPFNAIFGNYRLEADDGTGSMKGFIMSNPKVVISSANVSNAAYTMLQLDYNSTDPYKADLEGVVSSGDIIFINEVDSNEYCLPLIMQGSGSFDTGVGTLVAATASLGYAQKNAFNLFGNITANTDGIDLNVGAFRNGTPSVTIQGQGQDITISGDVGDLTYLGPSPAVGQQQVINMNPVASTPNQFARCTFTPLERNATTRYWLNPEIGNFDLVP